MDEKGRLSATSKELGTLSLSWCVVEILALQALGFWAVGRMCPYLLKDVRLNTVLYHSCAVMEVRSLWKGTPVSGKMDARKKPGICAPYKTVQCLRLFP